MRYNKVNLRKEFFVVDLELIRKKVEELHGKVMYVAEPEALEYRQSLEITDEDFDYITEKTIEVGGVEAFEDE